MQVLSDGDELCVVCVRKCLAEDEYVVLWYLKQVCLHVSYVEHLPLQPERSNTDVLRWVGFFLFFFLLNLLKLVSL